MATIYSLAPFSDSTKEIRLITIEPGNFSDGICCGLKVVPINSADEYETLSYTWGDTSATEEIKIGAMVCNVTKNLRDALRHIRSEQGVKIIWVDAICINQADLAERNTQVQMMRAIYSNASVMNAWISNAEGDAELALPFIESFSYVFNQDNRIRSILLVTHQNLEDMSWADTATGKFILESTSPSSPNRAGWEAFVRLFDRPYFYRCWVLQEMCVSKNIFFGSGTFVSSA